ncbi:hypothetical protein ACIRYZ_13075 [Kitasatospora sp. NPDC101155]|uniref:hypothetical protein n=1 Tax=Kitasatospora sp. NPDC101155 TaxID=3364097 RepID=UPI00380B1DAF
MHGGAQPSGREVLGGLLDVPAGEVRSGRAPGDQGEAHHRAEACLAQAYVVEHLHHPGEDEDGHENWPPAYHSRLAALLSERAPGVDAMAFLNYLCE